MITNFATIGQSLEVKVVRGHIYFTDKDVREYIYSIGRAVFLIFQGLPSKFVNSGYSLEQRQILTLRFSRKMNY